jgi:pyridoxine 5-phosphate synthase
VTTEGGLDLLAQRDRVAAAIEPLRNAGIGISLFLDPDPRQIEAAAEMGANAVELHTGEYALAIGQQQQAERLAQLAQAARPVRAAGLVLHAGHGLTYRNVKPVAAIEGMSELNIGHSIVARAIMVGFEQAVREMKGLIA